MNPFTGDFDSVRLDTLAFMLLDNSIYYACGHTHIGNAINALGQPNVTWDDARPYVQRIRAYNYNVNRLVQDDIVDRLSQYSTTDIADTRATAVNRGTYSAPCRTRVQRSVYAPIPLADVRASIITGRVVPEPDIVDVAGDTIGISADTLAEIAGGRRRTERVAFGYGADNLRASTADIYRPFVIRSNDRVLHVSGNSTVAGAILLNTFIEDTVGTWAITREYVEMPNDASSGPALHATPERTMQSSVPAHAVGDVHVTSGAVVQSVVGTAIQLDRPVFADGDATFRNSAKWAWDVFDTKAISEDIPTVLDALNVLRSRNKPPQNNAAVWWLQAQRAHARLGQRYALDLVLQGKFLDYLAYTPSRADEGAQARALGRYAT